MHIIIGFIAEDTLSIVNRRLRHAELGKNMFLHKFTVCLPGDCFNDPRKQVVIGIVIVEGVCCFFL